MELPIPEGVVENARNRNEASMQKLHGDNKDGQGHGKKVTRAMEQEERKRLNKSGHVQLTYGDEEVEDRDKDAGDRDEEMDCQGMVEADGERVAETDADIDSESSSSSSGEEYDEANNILAETAMRSSTSIRKLVTVVSVTRKTCVCGSSDHMRRSNKKCPQYKPRKGREKK
ncbi:uncharacterized protein LOC144923262 [Branchiostoma floridae x Branchiostoma belcheri]